MKVNSKNYKEMTDRYWELLSKEREKNIDIDMEVSELSQAIERYQRFCIYKACIKHLKNKRYFTTFFEACAVYSTNAAANCEVGQETYEIGRFDTKSGNPELVYF